MLSKGVVPELQDVNPGMDSKGKEIQMKNAGILVFNNIELLDFAGPYEVFSVTGELSGNKLCRTFIVEEHGEIVKSVNGLKVIPDYSFADSPDIDILIIPGGAGSKEIMENESIINWVLLKNEKSEVTYSVCSGSRILGRAGLLDNIEYTTHHEVIDDMLKIAPKGLLRENMRFTGSGKIFSSAGISAGIDLSLHIVERLFGRDIMERTKAYMEYGDWKR